MRLGYPILANRLLCALILALPFEYFILGRERALYTSLKVQLALFLAAWVLMTLVEVVRSGWRALCRPLHLFDRRFLLAVLCFAGSQVLAAALAEENTANTARAAAKTCLGVIVMIATADVVRSFRQQSEAPEGTGRALLVSVGIAGASCALIGLAAAAGFSFFREVVEAFQPQKFLLGGHLRFTSTMEYPTTAGSLFSASLFSTLALAIYRPPAAGRWRGVGWLGAALATAAALALTYSKGAIGSTVAGLAVCVMSEARSLSRRGRTIVAAAIALALFGLTVVVARSLAGSGEQSSPRRARIALYGLKAAEELKFLAPDRTYRENIGVQNNSSQTWAAGEFGLAGRWYDVDASRSSGWFEATAFPRAVRPGGRIAFPVAFHTPQREGDYLLIWFVVRRDREAEILQDSYSPAVVCGIRRGNNTTPPTLGLKAQGHMKTIREERRRLATDFVPTRPTLWLAALRMFLAHPLLGVGPDNFRILKWNYMNLPEGDETILANNLFLEFLSGSGVVGLGALLWFLWEISRRVRSRSRGTEVGPEAAVRFYSLAYFTAFLVHGLVDYFLKFTPTFLLFWITVGLAVAGEPAAEAEDATRI